MGGPGQDAPLRASVSATLGPPRPPAPPPPWQRIVPSGSSAANARWTVAAGIPSLIQKSGLPESPNPTPEMWCSIIGSRIRAGRGLPRRSACSARDPTLEDRRDPAPLTSYGLETEPTFGKPSIRVTYVFASVKF